MRIRRFWLHSSCCFFLGLLKGLEKDIKYSTPATQDQFWQVFCFFCPTLCLRKLIVEPDLQFLWVFSKDILIMKTFIITGSGLEPSVLWALHYSLNIFADTCFYRSLLFVPISQFLLYLHCFICSLRKY